jgi:hypothetical protein
MKEDAGILLQGGQTKSLSFRSRMAARNLEEVNNLGSESSPDILRQAQDKHRDQNDRKEG